ncbi:MAG: YIP1 family protein [Terriglobales bacterium]
MTPEAPLASRAAAGDKRSSSFTRLFSVFSSPGATFSELARDPHFILCWCVQVVVSLLVGFTMLHRVGVYALARQALAQRGATQALSGVQLQHALAAAAIGMRFTYYLAPIGTIVVSLIMAGIFLGLVNFVLGYEANYKQSVAVVSYAYLVQTLYWLLTIVVLWLMANPASVTFTNPIGTNLGFFLDKNATSPFLYALATHMDVFAIWTVILLGIGLSKLGGKKGKVSAALGGVVVLWLLYIFVSSGVVALFA